MNETKKEANNSSPVEAVVMWFKMLIPRFRVSLNSCPLCNSDAPELDNCPLCGGYHSARGDEYPPEKELKQKWLKEMYSVKRMTDLVDINDHMARACECGCVRFNLLRSGAIECDKCSTKQPNLNWSEEDGRAEDKST